MKFFDTLNTFNRTKNKIWSNNRKLRELKELAGFPSRGGFDGMPRSQSSSGDSKIISYLSEIERLEKEIKDLNYSLMCMQNDLYRFLDLVEDFTVRQIVEIKIFTPKKSWDEISLEVQYSTSHVKRLFQKGIVFLRAVEL